MDIVTLGIIVGVVIVAWFLVRQLIEAITCGVRMLLFIVVIVVVLYLFGSFMGWPIIDEINRLL